MTGAALWTAGEAATATGGRAVGDWEASGVSIDSREISPGDLFVALRGPNHDGHDHVKDALAAGAAAVVIDHENTVVESAPRLVVGDTMEALGGLGAAGRARTRARIVCVTGSAGKTSTKEALRHALARQGETSASVRSFNNQWGVPLSLARMSRGAAFGVFEIGMNHAGEIGPLSRLARPDVALITNVERAHIAFFDSVEAIADAKAEIFEALGAKGTAVLNRDNALYSRLEQAARARGVGRILGFGTDPSADIRLTGCETGPDGSRVTADVAGTVVDFRLGAPGRHWVMNVMAALGCIHALGADVARAAASFADLHALEGRGTSFDVPADGGAIRVIDDSYNANPASMRAAIAVFGDTAPPGPDGRRIAILGDMRELGRSSAAEHAALAGPLSAAGVDLVLCAGTEIVPLVEALPETMRGPYAETSEALADAVLATVRPGDLVLIKGSYALRMAALVEALRSSRGVEVSG